MNKTNDFKYNLPAYSDPVDIEDLNDNFRGIDDALMAGLCKKDYTGNNMGSSDPSARKYAWAPWLEIVNDNEFDVVVTDRNAPVGSEEATINIAAGQTFRKYINGRYYMNFYVQDQHDVTFKWFTNAETYINESGGGGGGTGTVTSVSVQGGSGSHLTASGNPIETSGTITIDIDDGYSIPSDNEQTAWDGKAADLKAEIDSSTYVLTLQLKDSAGNLIGTAKTIDLPLETMVVNGEYDSQTQKIKLELKNGNYVEFSVADLVSGLQTELSASNKLDPDYIDYDSSHRAVSDTEKDTWNSKQNAISDLATIRSGAAAGATAVQPSAMQTALDVKQDSLNSTQLAAVNSGIDGTKVAQISTNQTNILYALRKVGTNMFNFEAWANNATVTNYGTKSVSENTITISATNNSDTYTEYSENQYPVDARIPVNAGDKLYMSWDYSSADNVTGNVYIFGNASTSSMANANATDGHLEYTVPASGISYITMRVGLGSNQSGKSGTWSNIQIIMKSAYDSGLTNFTPYALPNYDLTRAVSELQKKAVKVYTYHVNPNESDPEDAVTYLDDATGLTPAKMGASSFSYGSWANAWFLPRPCMLKSDGTVAYYLNPNDYSKKTDGTASDIADVNFDGNVMLEFPKIWVKRVNDGNGARTVSIAPVNVDGTYKCWSNINAEDKEVDHFYLPAYNGTIHSSKMRSLSGVTLNSTYAPNYTRAQDVTAATANNPTGKNMWYTETWADFCLIYDLLYLMGKSLDVQRTFGQGLSSGSETAMRAYVTGTHNAKGLFYGDISGTSTAVKVLGMENLWGCRWHGVAGLINDNGTLKVKMTYGVADGSTAVGYNTTGSGYLNYGSAYGANGFVKKMQADNTMGYKIIETAGTDATYYCDYYYANNSQSNYALLGGCSGNGARCGFYVGLGDGAATADWSIGGSLSCRP